MKQLYKWVVKLEESDVEARSVAYPTFPVVSETSDALIVKLAVEKHFRKENDSSMLTTVEEVLVDGFVWIVDE